VTLVVGGTNSELCPVTVVLALEARSQAASSGGEMAIVLLVKHLLQRYGVGLWRKQGW